MLGAWSEEPLLVRRPDAGVTAYGWDGDTLRRWTWEPDGRATDAVIVVRGVVSWRWRWPGGSAVDVQLETSTASRRVAIGAGEAPDARSTRRETWRFAMRGTRVGSGW